MQLPNERTRSSIARSPASIQLPTHRKSCTFPARLSYLRHSYLPSVRHARSEPSIERFPFSMALFSMVLESADRRLSQVYNKYNIWGGRFSFSRGRLLESKFLRINANAELLRFCVNPPSILSNRTRFSSCQFGHFHSPPFRSRLRSPGARSVGHSRHMQEIRVQGWRRGN